MPPTKQQPIQATWRFRVQEFGIIHSLLTEAVIHRR